jgi:hypothetical protein
MSLDPAFLLPIHQATFKFLVYSHPTDELEQFSVAKGRQARRRNNRTSLLVEGPEAPYLQSLPHWATDKESFV